MLYGVSGSSKWLLDASMVIWNLLGIVALVALVGWMRQRGLLTGIGAALRPATAGERPPVSGRRTRLTMPEDLIKAEMAHARSISDETSEEILERELARSGLTGETTGETPTSEDILRNELEQARGFGEKGGKGKRNT
jgi:hypothetical protein